MGNTSKIVDGPATLAVESSIGRRRGSSTETVIDGNHPKRQQDVFDVHVLYHAAYELMLDCPNTSDLEPFPTISWADDEACDDPNHSIMNTALKMLRQENLLRQLSRGLERQCRKQGSGTGKVRRLVRCAELYPSLVAFNEADNDDGHSDGNAEYGQRLAVVSEQMEWAITIEGWASQNG